MLLKSSVVLDDRLSVASLCNSDKVAALVDDLRFCSNGDILQHSFYCGYSTQKRWLTFCRLNSLWLNWKRCTLKKMYFFHRTSDLRGSHTNFQVSQVAVKNKQWQNIIYGEPLNDPLSSVGFPIICWPRMLKKAGYISFDCARPHIIHPNALHQHLRNGNTGLIKVALEPKDWLRCPKRT